MLADWKPFRFFLLALTLLIGGCWWGHRDFDRDSYKVRSISEVPEETYIPALLWDFIEDKKNLDGTEKKVEAVTAEAKEAPAPPENKGEGKEHGESKEHGEGQGGEKAEGGEASAEPPAEGLDRVKRFFPLQVYLVEKTKGVLGGADHLIKFDKGGGQLDLAKYIKYDRGTFLFAFDFELPEGVKDYHVFFVSRARKRKIEGEIFGAGCKKFFDLTSFYNKVISKSGIEANVTRARHISLLGGTYVIWYTYRAAIYMTQVTVVDSRFNDLACETKTTNQ